MNGFLTVSNIIELFADFSQHLILFGHWLEKKPFESGLYYSRLANVHNLIQYLQ